MKNQIIIRAVRVVHPGILELDWATGETLCVNLSDLPRRRKAFASLSRPEVFAKVSLQEWGHGLSWPDGLDLGADALYARARSQASLPTIDAMSTWMQAHCLNQERAAEAIGISRRMLNYYLSGAKPIPRTEIVKQLWVYIKKNGLQDKKNRRNINLDDKMKAVFGNKAQITMFDLAKGIGKHVK